MSTTAEARRDARLPSRRAVVLNADVAGYSRLLADDAAATVATMEHYQRLVAESVATSGGVLVNFVGDSFVAVFDDARAAMHAAVAICRAVRERNADLPATRRVLFRMGLDVGDVVIAEDGRHFGDPLNIAARIQALAQVGGINVTEAVYAELDEPALRLVPLGQRRLKNIPELVRVYRLVGLSTGDADAHEAELATRTPTIAVLPFSSSHEAGRRVAEALRVDVLTGLSKIPGLDVLADRTASTAEDSAVDGPAGAADYVLTSFVLAAGADVRVYVQVTDVRTMNRVWGERWTGSADELFALQDAVTSDTVRALEVELVIGEPARIYRSRLGDTALTAVYRGLQILLAGPRAEWRTSVDAFSSVAATPDGELVGAGLTAFSLWWGVMNGLSETPDADLQRARTFATRGVELGDDTGLSQIVTAALRLHDGHDPRLALEDAQRAVALRPTCDVSLAVEGSVHRYLGRWQAAIECCERAMRLSPLPRPWFWTVMASAYYVGERYAEAAAAAERVVERRDDDLEALLVLAAAQHALGLRRRAAATVDAIRTHFPDLRRDELWRHHPYRDPQVIQRWERHLAAAGLLEELPG